MKKQGKKQQKKEKLQEQWKNHRAAFLTYVLLRTVVILSLVRAAFRGDYESVFICAMTLVLFLLPSMAERRLRLDLPDTLEIVILCFIFAAEILGELQAWYVRFQGWDTLMHTMNGFLCAAVGFCLVDMCNRSERLKLSLSPLYLSIVAFCFSMTVGVLWEFFEFSMDFFFLQDMQKDTVLHTISSTALDPAHSNHTVILSSIGDIIVNGQPLGLGGYLDIGLYDTMKDLFVNFIGAVVFSVIGYFHIKSRGKNKFASRFIPVVLDEGGGTAENADADKTEEI